MNIIRKLEWGFSSLVYLVEIDGQKYVLKRCDHSDVVSDKKFIDIMHEHKLPSFEYFENKELKNNEILLWYIEKATKLYDKLDDINCKKWWEITRKIHEIKFENCFKYNEKGEQLKTKWSDYITQKINKAFLKADENFNYGFSKNELKQIKEYIEDLFDSPTNDFSLIHGDLHSANIIIKDEKLIVFDKNPEIFSGDPLLDLAIAMVDMPNGTLIQTDQEDHKDDKQHLENFIKWYQKDFLKDPKLNKYIMLIAFGRLYTPYSDNYKDIVYNLLKKVNQKKIII